MELVLVFRSCYNKTVRDERICSLDASCSRNEKGRLPVTGISPGEQSQCPVGSHAFDSS